MLVVTHRSAVTVFVAGAVTKGTDNADAE